MADVIGAILGIGSVAAAVVCACQLAKRLGYPTAAGFLLLLPVINIVTVLVWALRESPNELQIRTLRRRIAEAERPSTESALEKISG